MKTFVASLLALLVGGCASPPRDHGGPFTWEAAASMPSFGADARGQFYRYAPSVVQTDAETRHAYYCGNVRSGEIKDHVLHRVAHRAADGTWTWSSEDIALTPGDPVREPCSGFDCYHVCDPEYVEGFFRYRGTTYTRALLYTGNDLDASAHNSIGLALANAPEGPWVRYAAPLVSYASLCGDGAPFGWGVGQPSATSNDGAGHLWVFARVQCTGRSRAVRWEVNLSDFDDVHGPVVGPPLTLPTAGLTRGAPTPGTPDTFLNDASWVYDATLDQFYVVRSQHPLPLDAPTNITSQLQVAAAPGGLVRDAAGSWSPLGDIAPADDGQNTWVSGAARNQNGGIVRSVLGGPAEAGTLEVAYTTSAAGEGQSWLWTDRVEFVRGQLRE